MCVSGSQKRPTAPPHGDWRIHVVAPDRSVPCAIFATWPMFDTLVNTRWSVGSYDRPFQFPPPIVLGNVSIVPSVPGGVYMPFVYIAFLFQRSLQYFVASGVVVLKSLAGSKVVRPSGSGLKGNGCVGDVASPGTLLCGTGRSSMPKIGSPVSRLKTNNRLIFVITATAGTFWLFRRTVISAGAAGRSKSQRS